MLHPVSAYYHDDFGSHVRRCPSGNWPRGRLGNPSTVGCGNHRGIDCIPDADPLYDPCYLPLPRPVATTPARLGARRPSSPGLSKLIELVLVLELELETARPTDEAQQGDVTR
jgi:hypothetical protein